MAEIELQKRYPDSRPEDITDAYMRGVEVGCSLGRGTCRLEPYAKEICGELCHTFKCSACKSTVATPRVDYYIPSQLFKYCPFCGRKVVEERTWSFCRAHAADGPRRCGA